MVLFLSLLLDMFAGLIQLMGSSPSRASARRQRAPQKGGLIPGQNESGGSVTHSALVVPLPIVSKDTWLDPSTQESMEKINSSESPFGHT